MAFRLPQPPRTPPPPTDMERIAKAIEILNSTDCEYEIRIKQTIFTKNYEDRPISRNIDEATATE